MNLSKQPRRRLAMTARYLTFAPLLPLGANAQGAIAPTEVLERLAKEAHAKFAGDQSGKNADYIPALAKVPSSLFGITIVPVDGKIINVGDVDYPFSMQSCSK